MRATGIPSRLKRRFFIFVWGAFLLCATGAKAEPVRTLVQDTLYRADGSVAHGKLTIRWNAFSTSAGEAVAAGEMTESTDVNGGIAIPLIPNAGSNPAGTYYTVVIKLDDGTTSEEQWVVPTTSPTTVAAIRAKVMPQAVAAQFVTEAQFGELATVAETGNYNDLVNKPVLNSFNPASPGPIGGSTPSTVNATEITAQSVTSTGGIVEAGDPGDASIFANGDSLGPMMEGTSGFAGIYGWNFSTNAEYPLSLGDNQQIFVEPGANGNVGINNDAPTHMLDVAGSGNFDGPVTAQSVNGVLNATMFPGIDASAEINACIAQAISNGGGVCDAQQFTGIQVMSQQINVGSEAQTTGGPGGSAIDVALLIPSNAVWEWNITDGVSCGIKQFSNTRIESSGATVVGMGLTLLPYNNNTKMDSLYCTDPSPVTGGNYIRASGFNAQAAAGFTGVVGTFANGVVHISKMFDESSFNNVEGAAAGPPFAAGVGGSCTARPEIGFVPFNGVVQSCFVYETGAGCGTGSGITWQHSATFGNGTGMTFTPTWSGGALSSCAVTNGGSGFPSVSPYGIHVDDTCCGDTFNNVSGMMKFGIDEVVTGVTTTAGSNVIQYSAITTDNVAKLVGMMAISTDNSAPAAGGNGAAETIPFGTTIVSVTGSTITLSANAVNSTTNNTIELLVSGSVYDTEGGQGGGGTTTQVTGHTSNKYFSYPGVPNLVIVGGSNSLSFHSTYMEKDNSYPLDANSPFVYVGFRATKISFDGVNCAGGAATRLCIYNNSPSLIANGVTSTGGILDKYYGTFVAPTIATNPGSSTSATPQGMNYSHDSYPLTKAVFMPSTVGWYRVYDGSRLFASPGILSGSMEIYQLGGADSEWDFADGIWTGPSSLSVKRALNSGSNWGSVSKVEVSKSSTNQYVDVYVSQTSSTPVVVTFRGTGIPGAGIIPVPVAGATPPSDANAAMIDLTTLKGSTAQATTETHQAASYYTAGTVTSAATVLPIWYDVRAAQFAGGAKCDGVTDDSAAFIALDSAITAAVASGYGSVLVNIPPGNCMIKQDVQLLSRATSSSAGLVFRGSGRGVSRITFNPPNSATTRYYLFHNNSAWMHIDFENMSFYGDTANISGDTGYTETSWMLSNSTGTAQNYTFENVNWSGFDRGLDLTGNNTNSEMDFHHCGMHGYLDHFLYVDPSVGSAGDQFVNYNFYDTEFEVNDGNFIDMAYGGSVNVYGGSLIHINTPATGQAPSGVFFNLGQGATTHNLGSQRLYVNGTRIEHRAQGSMLINSAWTFGSITFDSIDESVESYISGSQSWKTASFNFQSNNGPSILFRSSLLMGQHEYVLSTNDYRYSHAVTYEHTSLANHVSPADFLIYTVASGNTAGTTGGWPVFNFEKCQFPNVPTSTPNLTYVPEIYTSNYGFSGASAGVTSEKVLSIKSGQGILPYLPTLPSISAQLPLNAIITKIVFYSPAGAVTDGHPAQYQVQTNESTPTVLATLNTTPTAASAGFLEVVNLAYLCGSDQTRTISIVNTQANSQANGQGVVLIYYIG